MQNIYITRVILNTQKSLQITSVFEQTPFSQRNFLCGKTHEELSFQKYSHYWMERGRSSSHLTRSFSLSELECSNRNKMRLSCLIIKWLLGTEKLSVTNNSIRYNRNRKVVNWISAKENLSMSAWRTKIHNYHLIIFSRIFFWSFRFQVLRKKLYL